MATTSFVVWFPKELLQPKNNGASMLESSINWKKIFSGPLEQLKKNCVGKKKKKKKKRRKNKQTNKDKCPWLGCLPETYLLTVSYRMDTLWWRHYERTGHLLVLSWQQRVHCSSYTHQEIVLVCWYWLSSSYSACRGWRLLDILLVHHWGIVFVVDSMRCS